MDKIVSINIAGWLACFVFVVAGINSVFKLWANARGEKPQPSNPELGLTQRELRERIEKAQEDIDTIRANHVRDRESDRVAATTRSAGIYKKIDDTSDRLNTKIDDCERRLLDKQEKLPERVMALFRGGTATGTWRGAGE